MYVANLGASHVDHARRHAMYAVRARMPPTCDPLHVRACRGDESVSRPSGKPLHMHVMPGSPDQALCACMRPRRGDETVITPEWRVRSVQAAVEWVENWTAGPDLADMVRRRACECVGVVWSAWRSKGVS